MDQGPLFAGRPGMETKSGLDFIVFFQNLPATRNYITRRTKWA
jgi:hypothetical protein